VTQSPIHRFAALALVAVSTAILGGSVLCAWLISRGWGMQWRVIFRLVCHGIPSRCLLLFGVPMPICARCTAIYGGLIVGALLSGLMPDMRERTARIVVALAALPMAIDGGTQLIRLRESTNELRLETGLVAGIAIALWALTAVRARPGTVVHSSLQPP
jgi:uncharacterized membrane protein